MWKKEWNRIMILIIAKKVYNVLLCRIGMGFAEDREGLYSMKVVSHFLICLLIFERSLI